MPTAPTAIPTSDGLTNASEFASGSHPRGFVHRYFAEGVSSTFFSTRVAVLNPGDTDRHVLLRFEKADGAQVPTWRTIPARTRTTVFASAVAGLETAEFATHIEADGLVVADRLVSWDARGYGSHLETAMIEPRATWHFAEGATHSGFDLFYLFQNPHDAPLAIDVTFLRPAPAHPFVHRVTVGAHARATLWANTLPDLVDSEVSAVATSADGRPFTSERAMYRTDARGFFSSGHDAAGIPHPSPTWFFAEGATGPFLDTFLLFANLSASPIIVDATYLLDTGATVSRSYDVGASESFHGVG